MRAMLGMKKFDIAELRAAYEGKLSGNDPIPVIAICRR